MTQRPAHPFARRPAAPGLPLALCLSLGATACKGEPRPEAAGDAKAGPAHEAGSQAEPAKAEAEKPRVGPRELLSWLDPDARSVALLRDLGHLDPDAFSAVFALPPEAEALIQPLEELDWSLGIVLGTDGPAVEELFGSTMLAFKPAVARAPYLVRSLKVDHAALEAALGDAVQAGEVQGIRVLSPKGAFAYNLALVDPGIVAFVPVGEIGSGIGPLTAGRDMPPKEIENDMVAALEADPDLLGLVVASGPLLHLDIDPQVARFRLSIRRFQRRGLDVEVAMELLLPPGEDAQAVATRLDARRPTYESDRIAEMAEKVAFTAEGPITTGRLQLTPEMVSVLEQPE